MTIVKQWRKEEFLQASSKEVPNPEEVKGDLEEGKEEPKEKTKQLTPQTSKSFSPQVLSQDSAFVPVCPEVASHYVCNCKDFQEGSASKNECVATPELDQSMCFHLEVLPLNREDIKKERCRELLAPWTKLRNEALQVELALLSKKD